MRLDTLSRCREDSVVLLVEDDSSVAAITERMLEREGFGPIRKTGTGEEALVLIEKEPAQAVLLDLGLPGVPGETILERLREDFPDVPVIVVTALGEVDTAVRCMSKGAFDYVVKGSDPGRIVSSLKRATDAHRRERELIVLRERLQSPVLNNPEAFTPIVTVSERMRTLFRFVEAVAPTEEPVLITGETGVGKELFARAVHDASGRRGPFVAANLGGVDESMISDTLFGHRTGAYTGAGEVRAGLVTAAAGGTLFLDEIGDLGPSSQVKLLRLIENREYYPLGSDFTKRSDARIVAATNKDLKALAAEGRFRKDLLYRLAAFELAIPPLRERPEDIPLLCAHWLGSEASNDGPRRIFSSEALAALVRYAFPGNVRELRNLVLRARVLSPGSVIDEKTVGVLLGDRMPPREAGRVLLTYPNSLPTIRGMIEDLIAEALSRTGGNQKQASALLGITPQALSKRLKTARKA